MNTIVNRARIVQTNNSSSYISISEEDLQRIRHLERNVLTNGMLINIYRQMLQQPGVHAIEVLTAMISNPTYDMDDLLLTILSQREISSRDQDHDEDRRRRQLAQAKALEDAEYDRAVLLSEKDRDFEEQRKKRRVIDLTFDCHIPIFSAPEFTSSLLLGKLYHKISFTSSTNRNSYPYKGSFVIQSVVEYITTIHSNQCTVINLLDDHNDDDSKIISTDLSHTLSDCSIKCTKNVKTLRSLLIRLLLLEKDATKYYLTIGYPYLELLAEGIDEKFSKLNKSESSSLCSTEIKDSVQLSSQKEKDKKMTRIKGKSTAIISNKKSLPVSSLKFHGFTDTNQNTVIATTTATTRATTKRSFDAESVINKSGHEIITYLEQIIKSFEFDLYHLPTDGMTGPLGSPLAFRIAEETFRSMGRVIDSVRTSNGDSNDDNDNNNDDESIEIVQNPSSHLLVKKEKECQVSSWSDISDYESD